MRQGQPEETFLVEHENPEFVTTPRYWVSEEQVLASLENKGGNSRIYGV